MSKFVKYTLILALQLGFTSVALADEGDAGATSSGAGSLVILIIAIWVLIAITVNFLISRQSSWISKNLNKDEKIIFETRLFRYPIIKYIRFLFIVPYLKYKRTEFIVTNKRIIKKSGIFGTDEAEVPLDKVDSSQFHQGLMGKMFGYGNLRLEAAPPWGHLSFWKIAKVNDFKSHLITAQESFLGGKDELLAAAIATKLQK